jgi:hypothetical protein
MPFNQQQNQRDLLVEQTRGIAMQGYALHCLGGSFARDLLGQMNATVRLLQVETFGCFTRGLFGAGRTEMEHLRQRIGSCVQKKSGPTSCVVTVKPNSDHELYCPRRIEHALNIH